MSSPRTASTSTRDKVRHLDSERDRGRPAEVTPAERRMCLPRHDAEVRVQEVGQAPPASFVHDSPNSDSTCAPIAPGQELGIAETMVVPNALGIDRADLVVSSLGFTKGLRTTVRPLYPVGEVVRGSLGERRSMEPEGARR